MLGLFPGRSVLASFVGLDVRIGGRGPSVATMYIVCLNAGMGFVSTVVNLEGDVDCVGLETEILKGIRQHIPDFESTRLYMLMCP